MTLDQLVVSLVLDTAGFVKGQKEAISSVEKTKTEVVKHATAIEGAIGKASDSFESLAGKALAVFAIFAGARSVEEFTRRITNADAAIGRLSASMGQSPQDVSAIGKAVERMGGSADTAMGGLRGLSDALEDLRTKGSSAIMEPLAKLQAVSGKAIDLKHGLVSTFLSISTALKAEADKGPEGRTMASYFGRQIFGSDDLTNLAIQGGDAVRNAMAQSARHGVVNPADVEAAQKLQTAFIGVRETIEDAGRKIETALTPYLTTILGQLDDWLMKNKDGLVADVQKAVESFGKAVTDHKDDIKAFGDEVVAVAKAAGHVAEAFGKQSPAVQALEAFGAAALLQVNGPLATLARVMVGLGLMNPAVLGTLAVGGVLASGDPDKIPLIGKHPDVQPQDNDLGLPGVGDRRSDTGDVEQKSSGFMAWLKKTTGWGDRLRNGDDARARDAAVETAEGVKKLVAQGEKAGGGSGEGGEGGAGGGTMGAANRLFARIRAATGGGYTPAGGGGTTPAKGALAANQKEAYAAALKEGLSPTAARALVANMSGEGLAVPHDRHWDGTHFAQGIVQWDPTRTAAIAAHFGKEPKDMTVAEQTRAAIWEMKNKYPTTWHALQGNNNADMIGALVDDYERPANRARAKSQRMGYYRGFNPGETKPEADPAPKTPAPGAGTPVPSDRAVTDAEVFAARQRIINGSRDPKDRALIERYGREQTKHVGPHGETLPEKTSLLDGLNRQAPAHVAMLASGAQAAAHAAHMTTTHHNDNSSETNINGGIHVHTNATDAHGIAADIGPALQRGQRAAKANYGLAGIMIAALLIGPEVMRWLA